MWTLAQLLRLAHSDACAELSDYARSNATTYADSFARGGELVEEAEVLVRVAENVRLLAVAAERARGVSWETIGEALGGSGGVSKQAAQKRFSERVEQLELDVLLPHREGPYPGAPGWSAGPTAASCPDVTLERLDAWAQRHHERSDGGKDVVDRLVSHGLRQRPARATELMGAVTKLAALVMEATGSFASRELPAGVSERYARRRLLETKLAMLDAIRTESTTRDSDAREQAARVFDELVELRTDDAREQLRITWTSDEEASIALLDRAVAVLAKTNDSDREVRGWWLWGVDGDGRADDRGGAWPQLVDEDLDAEREHLEHAAREEIAKWIGSDHAKGVGPFEDGGIAGPLARNSGGD